ncbi:hypothetical protein [Bacillus tuaregi]|uniref:hypothetical protein n=1 Tax=Bacillus tuaregi TaxID=1816695 RepID=UPI0008F7ED1E|nr:hypothetical protein [Bacillus tuaregi]
MGKLFSENLKDHDSKLNELVRQSYTYFKGLPVYHIDDYFKPLAKLCNELGNRNDEVADYQYKQNVDQNSFYCEFVKRFMGIDFLYVRDSLFLHKLGDFILNINGCWHIVELKTTRRSNNLFTFNAEALHQFAKVSSEQQKCIHFLFYNYSTNEFNMVGYQQLIEAEGHIQLHYHKNVYSDYLAQIILSSPIPKKSLQIKENINIEAKENLISSSNIYYEFNLDELTVNGMKGIEGYMNSLLGVRSSEFINPIDDPEWFKPDADWGFLINRK